MSPLSSTCGLRRSFSWVSTPGGGGLRAGVMVADQARRANGAGTEPGTGPVHRLLRLAPPLRAFVQGELMVTARGVREALNPDTHQPETGPIQAEGGVEIARGGVDDACDVCVLG